MEKKIKRIRIEEERKGEETVKKGRGGKDWKKENRGRNGEERVKEKGEY